MAASSVPPMSRSAKEADFRQQMNIVYNHMRNIRDAKDLSTIKQSITLMQLALQTADQHIDHFILEQLNGQTS